MIELKNIYKSYRMGEIEVKAVNDVSLKIFAGEFVAIMGASGSGKSTLMHIMGLLDRPDSGNFFLAGQDVTRLSDYQWASLRNRLIGFVFQQFHLLARMTALENGELPLIYAGCRNMKEKVRHELTAVGLADRTTHHPNELSGGQQQRVAIARSLVNDPFILMADEPTGNLDTKSKDEIMGILKDLNRNGKTIIMVTHESEMAAHATRVIHMRDGKIMADEVRTKIKSELLGNQPGQVIKEVLALNHKAFDLAKFFDSFQQAVYAMVSHKLRSFLSILGILIGVAAVIAMLAIGEGAKESIEKRLAALGSNLLSVRTRSVSVGGVRMEAGAVARMTAKDAEAMAKLGSVDMVSPSADGRGQVVYGNKNWNTRIEGVGVSYQKIRAATPISGRFFTEDEVRSRAKVTLLGLTVAKELFGENNPVGADIKINRIKFQIIGILPEKGSGGFRDQDDVVIMPYTTAMYRVLGVQYLDSVDVEVKGPELMDQSQEEIRDLMAERLKLTRDTRDSVDIRNMAEIQETIASTTRTMSMLLGSIAAISLLVGGIGIMNIMLVSVTERTREIGLRKAIGATRTDIMQQFLVESVLMSLIGGIAGVLLGAGISLLIAGFAGWTVKISLSSILLSTIFSLGVGMIFGLWPANKASQLNPIEALRYE